MKKNWKRFGLITTILALSLVVVFAGAAFAQGPGPSNALETPNAGAMRFGHGGGSGPGYGLGVRGVWGGSANSLVAVAADVLGLDQTDLITQLADGASIADVATANGVEPSAIVDAFVAQRAEFLAQAVDAGRITQDVADSILANMQTTVTAKLSQPWSPKGYGNGTPGQGMGAGWVDADGDGVCDNLGSGLMAGHGRGHGPAGRGQGGLR